MVTHDDSKVCKKCKRELPYSEFYPRKGNRDGLYTHCKRCHCNRVLQNYAKTRDYALERMRQYYAKTCDVQYEYRVENREHIAEKQRQYRQSDRGKEIIRVKGLNRRARKRGNGGTHTAADIELVRKGQTNRKGKLICWWCDEPIEGAYHIDHRIPLSRGGTNDAGNLCLAHPTCNVKKHNKLPSEYNGRLI